MDLKTRWYMLWNYTLTKYPPFSWIDDAHDWIRYRTTEKYNCVNMSKTLKPGYYDIDTRILHANFTLLCSYVEKEMDIIDWNDCDESKHIKKEIDELYFWWKHVYPKYDENNPLFASDVKCTYKPVQRDDSGFAFMQDVGTPEEINKWKKACEDSWEYEAKVDKEIEDNLIRLIKLRIFLWS